jgi:hypothetical protein
VNSNLLTRRRILLGLTGMAVSGCRRSPSPAPPASGAWRELSFDVDASDPESHPQRALVLVPAGAADLPLLVALHGRGESGRGLDIGARAWRDDYDLGRLDARARTPPLTDADLLSLTTPERLERWNASLAAAPYRGMCVACPYSPDLPDRSVEGAAAFTRFVVDRLLPEVRREMGLSGAPPAGHRTSTGIDGVSMGGRLALFVGLSRPEIFGVVGALQPALRVEDARRLSELARAAMSRHKVHLRLVSSQGDPFLPAIRATSDQLRADGVPHEMLVIPGPHDYVWNRGPGGVEMLLWHERVQRGLAAPS